MLTFVSICLHICIYKQTYMFTYIYIYIGVDSSYDLDADGFVGQEDYRLAKHIDNTKKGIYIYIYIYIHYICIPAYD
jgi:hypothetical protein